MKNTWKIIKDAMNTPEKNSKTSKIKWGNVTSEKEIDIAETFNKYFSSIGKNLARNIQSSHYIQFNDFLGAPNPNSIFLVSTHREEVFKLVNALNDKKSCGFDGIDNCLLKKFIVHIVDPLVHIINL